MRQHNLNFYARRLGYAESTLSRACIRAEGVSAKRVIDQRIILEAKRMLVHSPLSVAEIGYALGFSEATNFNKFFRRLEQRTPQMFRERPCKSTLVVDLQNRLPAI
jgi:AraC-like DNA-binding protein